MKYRYTVYGNCQAPAVAKILNSCKEFTSLYEYVSVKAVHEMSIDEIYELNKNIFPTLDLFIFIPILQLHEQFTTDYILNNVLKKNAITICFQNIHFSVYYPQIGLIRNKLDERGFISASTIYHDINLLNSFKHDLDIEKFITQTIDNTEYYSLDSFNQNVNKNIQELKDRQENCRTNLKVNKFIPISDFILNNYKNYLLVYLNNHGTKFLYHYIVCEVLQHLNIKPITKTNIETSKHNIEISKSNIEANKFNIRFNIDFSIDPQNDTWNPIYPSIAKYLSFPCVNTYAINRKITDIKQIIRQDFEIYKKLFSTDKNVKFIFKENKNLVFEDSSIKLSNIKDLNFKNNINNKSIKDLVVYIDNKIDIDELMRAASYKYKYNIPLIGIFTNEYVQCKDNIFDILIKVKTFNNFQLNLANLIQTPHKIKKTHLLWKLYNFHSNIDRYSDLNDACDEIEMIFFRKINTEFRYGMYDNLLNKKQTINDVILYFINLNMN